METNGSRIRHLITFFPLLFLLWSCGVEQSKKEDQKAIFQYNQAEGLTSLDPAFASSQANIWATTQLFDGLVELDENLEIKPCLATSWEVSDSGKTYTFYLRKGVMFHDTPDHQAYEMTSKDVVYSFKRIIDTTALTSRGIWIFKDKVLQHSSGKLSDTCFKAVDEYTFRVYLEKPNPLILQVLAMSYANVVSSKAATAQGKRFRKHPVGTGPFSFVTWKEGVAMVYKKNEHYWGKDENGNPLPYLDGVKVRFIPDKNQAYRAFLLKDLDFYSGIQEGFIDDILLPNGDYNPKFTSNYNLEKVPYLNTEYLGFQLDTTTQAYADAKDSPILNADFRKALSYALDKGKLVRFVRNNVGIAGDHGFVPPAVPHFNTEKTEGYPFNIQKARRHLRLSGVDPTTMKPLELNIAGEHKLLSEFIVSQWQENLGIPVEIDMQESGGLREQINNGKIRLFRASWLGDYPSAENYLSLFYGQNWTPNGPNKTHYRSAEYDRLYEESATLPDSLRYERYQKLDQLAMKGAPLTVLFYDEVIRLTQKRVIGLKADPKNRLVLKRVRFANE
jgi:peptide/nickel transport system substrate-binding protein